MQRPEGQSTRTSQILPPSPTHERLCIPRPGWGCWGDGGNVRDLASARYLFRRTMLVNSTLTVRWSSSQLVRQLIPSPMTRFLMHYLHSESPADTRQAVAQVILDIVKREGFRGLYSGLSSSLVGIAVTNG